MATFTITSCNLRWGLGVDDQPFDVDGAVASFGTDLVALQEVWDPDDGTGGVRRIGEELGYSVHEAAQSASHVQPAPGITADPEKADGTWGIALLSRLPVRSIRTLELGRLFERWDVAERTAILAEVVVEDQTVLVAAIHLSFVLPNAAVQLRRLRGLLPIGTPSVVVGDCNLWGPVAEGLLTGWNRAVRGRTWPAARPHSQLDHLLVSPEIRATSAQVLGPIGSDHLPIQATLTVA